MDRSKLKENLRCNTYLFQLAVENAFNHIIITDIEGKIIYANPAAEKMTGYSFPEMKGKTPALWGKQMNKKFYQQLWQTIKIEKKAFHGEIKNKRKNGQIYDSILTISPIIQNDKLNFFIGVEEDITEIKELDRKKTEFLSIASHQLRTPLGSMRWNIEMLLEEEFGKLNQSVREIVKQIYESNLRMIALVNDFLSVSRIEQNRVFDEPQLTDIVKLIRSVAAEIQIEAQKKSIIGELHFGKKPIPKIFIDPKRLQQVMHNLFSNAIKYNKPKGRVIVEVKKFDSIIQISVTDTGIGIPKKEQNKIFSKYFRADNAVRTENDGTGLGLFIVKSYVEAWGGKIWFKSKANKGTRFTFTLPLKPKSILTKKIKN